jgi:drug/metabolite transporter (DMT)-like permease
MNKSININTGLMLLIGILFTYFTTSIVATKEGSEAYNWGFILGRAFVSVLFPLFLVWIARVITRRKPIFTKGAFISWWILFILLSVLSLVGSMLPPQF